jgi:hypothetical protein
MSRTLIDYDSIREWLERYGASHASVRGTGHAGDAGVIHDSTGYSGAESLAPLGWAEWLGTFDGRQSALSVDTLRAQDVDEDEEPSEKDDEDEDVDEDDDDDEEFEDEDEDGDEDGEEGDKDGEDAR